MRQRPPSLRDAVRFERWRGRLQALERGLVTALLAFSPLLWVLGFVRFLMSGDPS